MGAGKKRMDLARWRDGEMEIEGENEIDSFYKERKREREWI